MCASNTSSKALKCCGHLFHSTEQTAMPSTPELPAVARCSLSSTNPLLLESAPHTTLTQPRTARPCCVPGILCHLDPISCFGICSLHLAASHCTVDYARYAKPCQTGSPRNEVCWTLFYCHCALQALHIVVHSGDTHSTNVLIVQRAMKNWTCEGGNKIAANNGSPLGGLIWIVMSWDCLDWQLLAKIRWNKLHQSPHRRKCWMAGSP